MVAGLLSIGVLGIMVDIWLAILIAEKGFFKFEIVVALHLGYSVRSPGNWWANLQDPFWTNLKEWDGPGMEEEGTPSSSIPGQHRRQCASRGSRGWWVQRALRPWLLCVRSHKEPFRPRLLHQLPNLLVPASLDFRWEGGVLNTPLLFLWSNVHGFHCRD